MSATRMLLYFVGGVLVVAGIIMLFFETGLAAWLPAGIALAGLIILIGVLVLGLSNRADTPAQTRVEEHVHEHRRD